MWRPRLPSPAPAAAGTPQLWDNLGSLSWPVTTRSETAQRYFDQGLQLAYAFNHAEAARAFRAAALAEPDCAMCYWGEAYVLGPNINYPMMPEAIAPAFVAVSKAKDLAWLAGPKERALIQALGKRYSADPLADRSELDAAYADAMTEAAASFGNDNNVQVLLADALMNLSPWDYWAADGATPKGRTAESWRRWRPCSTVNRSIRVPSTSISMPSKPQPHRSERSGTPTVSLL